MGEQQDLTAWVARMTAEGRSPEEIYLAALGDGWTVAAVQSAVAEQGRAGRAADLRTRVVRVVVAFGAILVGAGVFSFVAANWAAMSDWLRIAIIVVSMLLASVTGWWLRESRGLRFTGGALLLLGSIIFGAGIFLVAQIFNLSGNWPDGFLMWMIGTVAMAAATRLRALFILGLLVGVIPAVGYPFGLADPMALDAFLLTPAWLVFAGAVFALGACLLLRTETPSAIRDRW
jgi:uncharacterized membrane protein